MYEDEDLQEIHEDIQELDADISVLRRDLNNISASVNGSGENVILNKTAEARFKTPPLPMGNSEQVQYSGKQLIPFTNQDFTLNGVRHYVQNGTLYLNGTTTTETNQRNELYKSNFSMTLPAGTYYFKRGTSNIPMYIVKYDDNTNIVTNEGQFTLEETTQVYFGIYLYQITLNNEKIDCQLELGNSATSDEPYVGGQVSPNPDYPQEITNVTGDVEVVVENKNFFVPQTIVDDSNNAGVYLTNDGYIRYKTGANSLIIKPNLIKENIGYTFKMIGKSDTNNKNTIRFYAVYTDGTSKQAFSTVRSNTEEFAIFFTTNANKTLDFIKSDWTDELVAFIKIDEAMILEGVYTSETIPSYVPHKEQTFTFPLGNEKLMLGDYLADDGKHHVRGQRIFDGTENFTDEGGFYSLNISSMKSANVGRGLCTHYLNFNIYDNTKSRIRFGWGSTKIYFYDLQHTTLAEFKTFLAEQYQNETPVIAEYELGEETIIPYTSSQQEVYNAIKQSLSYEGQTNISSNQNAIFNVKAFKNMNTSIESLQSRIELLKGRS